MATKKKKLTKTASKPAVARKKSVYKKTNFWKVEFNVNSVYWIVIGMAVIATAILTYNTNQQISEIYDSIDATSVQADSTPTTATPTPVPPVPVTPPKPSY